ARQDDISALTEMEGSKRREFIHRMLGIDVLDRMRKTLRAAQREHGAVLRHLEEKVGAADAAQLAERVQAAEAERDRARVAVQQHQGALAGLDQQVADTDARLAPLRHARAKIAEAETRLAVSEARRGDLR